MSSSKIILESPGKEPNYTIESKGDCSTTKKVVVFVASLIILGGAGFVTYSGLNHLTLYMVAGGCISASGFVLLIVSSCIKNSPKSDVSKKVPENSSTEKEKTTSFEAKIITVQNHEFKEKPKTCEPKEIILDVEVEVAESEDAESQDKVVFLQKVLQEETAFIIKHLKEHAATYQKDPAFIKRAFDLAYERENWVIAKYLIQFKCDPTSFPQPSVKLNHRTIEMLNEASNVPLIHFTAAYGYEEGFDWVYSKESAKLFGPRRRAFIEFAIVGGNSNIIRLACEKGYAIPGNLYIDAWGLAPNDETRKALLSANGLKDKKEIFHYFLSQGNIHGIVACLQSGVDPYSKNAEGKTAFSQASWNPDCEAAFLSAHRFQYQKHEKFSFSEWVRSVEQTKPHLTQELKSLSDKPLASQYFYLAILVMDTEIVEELMKLGVDPTIPYLNEKVVVDLLLQENKAILVTLCKLNYLIPYSFAKRNKKEGIWLEVFEKAYSIKLISPELAILRATEEKNYSLIHVLVQAGCPLNGPLDKSALHLAAERRDKEALILLLNLKANPFNKDKEGKTPLYYLANDVNMKRLFLTNCAYLFSNEFANEIETPTVKALAKILDPLEYLAKLSLIKQDKHALLQLFRLGLDPESLFFSEILVFFQPYVKQSPDSNQIVIRALLDFHSLDQNHFEKICAEGIIHLIRHKFTRLIKPLILLGFPVGGYVFSYAVLRNDVEAMSILLNNAKFKDFKFLDFDYQKKERNCAPSLVKILYSLPHEIKKEILNSWQLGEENLNEYLVKIHESADPQYVRRYMLSDDESVKLEDMPTPHDVNKIPAYLLALLVSEKFEDKTLHIDKSIFKFLTGKQLKWVVLMLERKDASNLFDLFQTIDPLFPLLAFPFLSSKNKVMFLKQKLTEWQSDIDIKTANIWLGVATPWLTGTTADPFRNSGKETCDAINKLIAAKKNRL